MRPHHGSRASARPARSRLCSVATVALALACLAVGLSAPAALATLVAPVISGPTAIQFVYHPAGFRSAVTWDPVPDATEYQVYNADTLFFVGTVTSPSCAIYGMQGVLYHHYVVAVDSTGATSSPSNIVDIRATASVPPAPPAGFDVVPATAFSVQTSTAPPGVLPVKVPYDLAYVTGDTNDLRLMHFIGGGWVDITTSVDTTRGFVLGQAEPFSVFAVMEPNGAIEHIESLDNERNVEHAE